jgi:PadR family transcriptional regulator PadR
MGCCVSLSCSQPSPTETRSALASAAGKKILRDVFLGFVRVHVLHHAAKERIFGLEMMDELKRHGYEISAGTLYPLLHALEEGGMLTSSQEVVEGKVRRYYRSTTAGDALLAESREKIRELVEEVLEHRSPRKPSKPRAR